jgi:hypothetical protein
MTLIYSEDKQKADAERALPWKTEADDERAEAEAEAETEAS